MKGCGVTWDMPVSQALWLLPVTPAALPAPHLNPWSRQRRHCWGQGFIFVYLKIKKKFFILDMGHFKSLYEFVTILLLFSVLVFWTQGMWDLHSLTRDQTQAPCLGSVAH